MGKKLAIAMFGQKRLSREGGVEIVVKERSFWVDWKIIFKTFKVCLLGHGE